MDVRHASFEQSDDEYLAPTPDRVVDRKFFDYISDFVIGKLDGERVLELGVGDRVWTPKLVARFPDVTSVDASERLLAAVARDVSAPHWTPVASMFEAYAPDRPFDTVLATYVLEHVDDPALVLRRARESWLREGGRLAAVVPHALSLHRRLAVAMGIASDPAELGETDRRMGHKHCFTYLQMEAMLADAGFRVLERSGMLTKVLPNRLLVGCDDRQLEGLFKLGVELPIEYSGAIFYLAEAAPL